MPHVIRSTRPAPAYRTLRTGRTVYGGGGIRPDILVEADTAGFSNYYGELIRRGIVADFVGDWLDGSRDSPLAPLRLVRGLRRRVYPLGRGSRKAHGAR